MNKKRETALSKEAKFNGKHEQSYIDYFMITVHRESNY